jgi:hypothetical protein
VDVPESALFKGLKASVAYSTPSKNAVQRNLRGVSRPGIATMRTRTRGLHTTGKTFPRLNAAHDRRDTCRLKRV